MKIEGPLIQGKFVERPNRFITMVEVDGKIIRVARYLRASRHMAGSLFGERLRRLSTARRSWDLIGPSLQ